MKILAAALLAGAAALSASSAKATDFYTTSQLNPEFVQQVRLVCNEYGRCYRAGDRGVIARDSYAYGPRDRYIERRHYRDWDEGPRAGFRAPGVSVHVGEDRY